MALLGSCETEELESTPGTREGQRKERQAVFEPANTSASRVRGVSRVWAEGSGEAPLPRRGSANVSPPRCLQEGPISGSSTGPLRRGTERGLAASPGGHAAAGREEGASTEPALQPTTLSPDFYC